MKGFPSREQVERLKKRYPKGTQICCDYMPDDPNPIEPGTVGKVVYVDDIGTLHCTFDNGRQLGLVPGVDSFHVVQPAVSEAKKELTEKHSSRYGDVYVSTCYDNSIPRVDDMATRYSVKDTTVRCSVTATARMKSIVSVLQKVLRSQTCQMMLLRLLSRATLA